MRKTFVVGLAFLLALVTVASRDVAAKGGQMLEITVTNITRGQIISPAVVATHRRGLEPIFEVGSPASTELAEVAEDAMLGDLIARLQSDPHVKDVQTLTDMGGPILPGKSASITVDASGPYDYVSMVAMLVTTNDAFFGLDAVRAPKYGATSYYSPAYDAGSEANNEDCGFVPGPPCGGAGVRDTDGAEGFVHIHAGIHGIADLVPARDDWRNPVAKVTIRRIRNHHHH